MILRQLTWSDFSAFGPCYDPQERYGDFSGTILDLLNDDRIPPEDCIWAATREGILPVIIPQRFAVACVREIWDLVEDPRSREAVEVAERYLDGKVTKEYLEAAAQEADASVDAAWDAGDAVVAAAVDAAWAAVAAALDAGESAWAALAAARESAWAAGDAAISREVEILKELIEKEMENPS